MRKQYFFRPSSAGLLAWNVDHLVELSKSFPRKCVPLAAIRELDQPFFGDDEPPTWRSIIAHVRLMDEADLSYPIILASDGTVMDGMHRVAKAARQQQIEIEAVQFEHDPPPNHVGLGPADLPY